MRKLFSILLPIMLLAVGIVICALRWNAWFKMPAEPEYTGDTLQVSFIGFGDSVVPGFTQVNQVWADTCHPDTLSILLLGDVHNHLSHEDWANLSERHPGIDAYAQLGDLFERPYFYYQQELMHAIHGTRFDSLPILAIPGNHEYNKGIFPSIGDWWVEFFHNPKNGPSFFMGRTYYVDFTNVRFIGIDTNGLDRLIEFSRLMTWLRAAIEGTDKTVIVMMHHPVYSCARKRQNILTRFFLSHILDDADLVIAGHDHGYLRMGNFINTNSAHKYYKSKDIEGAEKTISNMQLYEIIDSWADTTRVQTRTIENGELVDEVLIYRE